MTLEEIPREWILKSALRILSRTKYKDAPAWVSVCDLCGVGSTSASAICRELKIDPNTPYKV
jgi:ribosomal protein S13